LFFVLGYTPSHCSSAAEPPYDGSVQALFRKSCANLI
jgi:hypothetical protein